MKGLASPLQRGLPLEVEVATLNLNSYNIPSIGILLACRRRFFVVEGGGLHCPVNPSRVLSGSC